MKKTLYLSRPLIDSKNFFTLPLYYDKLLYPNECYRPYCFKNGGYYMYCLEPEFREIVCMINPEGPEENFGFYHKERI